MQYGPTAILSSSSPSSGRFAALLRSDHAIHQLLVRQGGPAGGGSGSEDRMGNSQVSGGRRAALANWRTGRVGGEGGKGVQQSASACKWPSYAARGGLQFVARARKAIACGSVGACTVSYDGGLISLHLPLQTDQDASRTPHSLPQRICASSIACTTGKGGNQSTSSASARGNMTSLLMGKGGGGGGERGEREERPTSNSS